MTKKMNLLLLIAVCVFASVEIAFADKVVVKISGTQIKSLINKDVTNLNIDRGDGTKSYNLDGYNQDDYLGFDHNYTDEKSPHTIIINADNIQKLAVSLNFSITSLDVSQCPKLKKLYCHYNKLTSLNVSQCHELTTLICYENELTSLDVSDCYELIYVSGDIRPNLYNTHNVKVERIESRALSQSKSMPNPKGTISVNMRNSDNGKTIVTPSGFKSGFYIGNDNNFRGNGYTFVRIGKVKGLGNTFEKSFPETGWTDIAAVAEGYGYLAKYNDVTAGWKTHYIRIYVVREILSATEHPGIIGAEIDYYVDNK
ncbi:MAG: DUF5036 family protein [Bacteroidales bacterium]|jgi:hypothetical protein|nr:DUF5036 family protein [Bacteroidales bacterium]